MTTLRCDPRQRIPSCSSQHPGGPIQNFSLLCTKENEKYPSVSPTRFTSAPYMPPPPALPSPPFPQRSAEFLLARFPSHLASELYSCFTPPSDDSTTSLLTLQPISRSALDYDKPKTFLTGETPSFFRAFAHATDLFFFLQIDYTAHPRFSFPVIPESVKING